MSTCEQKVITALVELWSEEDPKGDYSALQGWNPAEFSLSDNGVTDLCSAFSAKGRVDETFVCSLIDAIGDEVKKDHNCRIVEIISGLFTNYDSIYNARVVAFAKLVGWNPAVRLPAPTITSITPNTGVETGGTNVVIEGTNFVDGTGFKVVIGGKDATDIKVESATKITAKTPPGAVGAADVVVVNHDGQMVTKAGGFTYTKIVAPGGGGTGGSGGGFKVTKITPDSCNEGEEVEVTIDGSGFVDGATVFFGSKSGKNVVFISADQLKVTAPARTAGVVDVEVKNPAAPGKAKPRAVSPVKFTYTKVVASGGGVGGSGGGAPPSPPAGVDLASVAAYNESLARYNRSLLFSVRKLITPKPDANPPAPDQQSVTPPKKRWVLPVVIGVGFGGLIIAALFAASMIIGGTFLMVRTIEGPIPADPTAGVPAAPSTP